MEKVPHPYTKPRAAAFMPAVMISFFSLLTSFAAWSQGVTATAKSDTTTILIGQQFNLRLELTHSKNQSVPWIEIPDTIGKLEVVQKSKIDTLASDSSVLVRRQTLTITGFDSGFYVITPFRFAFSQPGDTAEYAAETDPLLITVNTIPVDTTKAIKDIKGPVEVPWTLADFLPYIGGVIVAALLVWLIYYLVRKYRKKPVEHVPVVPSRPAHEIAIEELKKLEEEKLWQQGNFKSYHTRLTDVIRNYIENRWQITALEQTTDEILAGFSKGMLTDELYLKLKYLLENADLVKFAKLQPVAYENEQSLANAYEFVRLTASIPAAANEKKEGAA